MMHDVSPLLTPPPDAKSGACLALRQSPPIARQTSVVPGRFGTAPRRALLIDFENMLYERDRRVGDGHGSRRLEAILDMAGTVQHTFLVAGSWALVPYIAQLARRNVPLEIAPHGADGADHLLLARWRFLATRGYEEFLIASRDGIFAPIAAFHQTTVITPTLVGLSAALRTAARRTLVLPCN
jgi:hypothetical protein